MEIAMSEEPASLPEPDLAHADIGIVCALPMELAPFLSRCEKVRNYSGGAFTFRGGRYDKIRIVVAEAGVGFERARRATQALREAHTPKWILACGFCGALRDGVALGDVVVANSIVDVHGQEITVDLKLSSDPARKLHVGRLLTADHMVREVAEKRSLGERFQAAAVDMETLAVAQVCRDTQTRFMAVRTVSDDLSADLPPEVLSVTGSTGNVRIGATLGALWNRPSSLKDMWRLREQAQLAADRLADFLDGVVVQLAAATN